MKKTIIVLLALFMTVGLCIAQTMEGYFSRSGMATQELQSDGLTAAHPTFPIGTKVRITNVSNGADIEVTIVGQIPLSGDRIIDLSPGAAYGLGFNAGEGGPVAITTYTLPSRMVQPPPPESALPEIVAISPPEPVEVAVINPPDPPGNINTNNNTSTSTDIKTQVEKETVEKTEKATLPFNITINNYLTNTNTSTSPQERPSPRGKDTKPGPDPVPPPPAHQPPAPPPASRPPEPPLPVHRPVSSPMMNAPPVDDVKIIPALPSPHSDKTYRLLVGNYNSTEEASMVYQQLQAVGFEADQEYLGDWCKVYVSGIPASSVYYAAKRLGAIGFAQVWVYE